MVVPTTTAGRFPAQPRSHASTGSTHGRRPDDGEVAGIQLAVEDVDPVTRLRTRRLVVPDSSEGSPTRQASQSVIAVLDDMLLAHEDWAAPTVVDGDVVVAANPAAEWLYTSSALREWRRELVPSAMALYPVQRECTHLPSGAPVDDMTRRVLVDSLDAIGIRTRARIMADVAVRVTAPRAGHGPVSWVSLACGAAVPVLDALSRLGSAADVHVSLVDLDAGALDFARELAVLEGLVEDEHFSVLRRDLVRSVVAGDSLVDELGEQRATVVEALGIFEYFSDASCVRLLRNAYRLVAPGGALVVANMLSDRPQLAFNQRGAGWPRLYPRSAEGLAELVERAGLPLHQTTVSIPQDGVYAVVDVTR